MKQILLVLALSGLLSEINVGDSLDWMTIDSELILKGRVLKADRADRIIKVQEVLKGEAEGPEIRIRVWDTWSSADHSLLFFLKKGREKDEAWTLRTASYGIVDLEEPARSAITAELKVLRDADQILKRVRSRIQLQKDQPDRYKPVPETGGIFWRSLKGRLLLEVDFESEAWKALYSGSACYLVVPADPSYRAQAMEMARSKHASERERGARWLVNYGDPDAVTLLKALLKDTHRDEWVGAEPRKVVRRTYPVRTAAYESLTGLGISVEKPVLEE
jgi:hypothetical protein